RGTFGTDGTDPRRLNPPRHAAGHRLRRPRHRRGDGAVERPANDGPAVYGRRNPAGAPTRAGRPRGPERAPRDTVSRRRRWLRVAFEDHGPDAAESGRGGDSTEDGAVAVLTARYRRSHTGPGAHGRLDSVLARRHLEAGRTRRPAESPVSLRPQRDADAGHGAGTVLQVGTDDAPFRVESLTALLGSAGIAVDHIVHPILLVRRDSDGRLVSIEGDAADAEAQRGAAPGPRSAQRDLTESWMHLELTGLPEEMRTEVEDRVRGLLADIGWVVEDTVAMHD